MNAAVITIPTPQSTAPAAVERYQDAYCTAERAVASADIVRRGGIFVGGVVFVAALVAFQLSPAERSGFPVLSVCLIAFAVWVVLVSQVVGLGIHILGNVLKAAVDSNVNSSPFLSNAERAKAMSLGNPLPSSHLAMRVA